MFASCRSGRTLTIARGDHWTGIKSKNPDAPAVKREAEEYWVKGLHFLRAELPGILAKRTDVLSPRMSRVIEDQPGDWRRLDERIDANRKDHAIAGPPRQRPASD